MNVITFPAPPKDFDPLTASDKSLAQFGLPRRPDPNTEPGLRRLWDKAFARKPTFLQAELVEDNVRRSFPRGAWKKDQFGLMGNWAGAIVDVSSYGWSPPEPANMVFAEWKVPKIQTEPEEPGSQVVGFWVGLGGSEPLGGGQVLQAGTAAGITGNSVSYWAWTEWDPKSNTGSAKTVKNFAVKPGDLVSVLVCAPEKDHGYVSMMNYRTNIAISIGISDPAKKTPYDGSSVEWIVEATGAEMPNFKSVTFKEVSAGTKHHTIDLSNAYTVNTVNNLKKLATGKVLAAKNEVEVIWDAAK